MFADECHVAAEALGGFERIDGTLTSGIYDGLVRNPYGFRLVESDWYSSRLIFTKPYKDVPALVWIFAIDESGDVIINHVEEFENYT